MKPEQFVITPDERSPALNVIGVQITVLVPDTASASQQITLQSGAEGAGPPPHTHDWDESFYVTRGEVRFSCAGQISICTTGTLVHVPAGTVHAFNFGPGGGEMLEVTGSGSQAIKMFAALDHELPPGPPDIPKAIEVAGRYGLVFHL